jgi:L-asparaginase
MLKKIVFLGMGGTIAGTAESATDNVGYQAAQLGVEQLLSALPALRVTLADHAPVVEQVAQIDSKDMGWPQWCALASRVAHYLALPDVRGLVITHGTDTLEETAFFLSWVLPAEGLAHKAVVLTCAMRPSTSLSPDGPQNLLDAVALARAPDARGVLAVCAGTVHAARDVQKVHPYRLDAFTSGDAGPLGYVEEGRVRWVHPCPPAAPVPVQVAIGQLSAQHWPRVEIVMNYAGATGATVRALCAPAPHGSASVRGIVVAGTGNGTVHQDLEAALQEVQGQGVRVVRATRCAWGQVVPGTEPGAGLPHSEGLSPVKARIALMLELLASESKG